jgi:hypothetical protein
MLPLNDALLHCLKYSGQDVYGIFFSKSEGPEICVPLFHSPCISVPLIRTAFTLLEEHTNMKIVGIYFANTDPGVTITPVARWIHSQIMLNYPSSEVAIWKYDGDAVTNKSLGIWPFTGYSLMGDKEYKKFESELLGFDKEDFKRRVTNDEYLTGVFDFEDHLQNPSVEWLRI